MLTDEVQPDAFRIGGPIRPAVTGATERSAQLIAECAGRKPGREPCERGAEITAARHRGEIVELLEAIALEERLNHSQCKGCRTYAAPRQCEPESGGHE